MTPQSFFKALAVFLVGLGLSAVSAAHPGEQHKHVHGEAKLGLAFEGAKGDMEFNINAAAIIGREYAAKNDKDKGLEADTLKKLEADWSKLVILPAEDDCKVSKFSAKIDYHKEGAVSHADLDLDASVVCAKPLAAGQKLEIRLIEAFPKIQKINLDLLADKIQKGAVLQKKIESVEL